MTTKEINQDLFGQRYKQNIDALYNTQPEVAEKIEKETLPSDLEFISSLDGTITAFSRGVFGPSGWFGRSSAPSIREGTIIDNFHANLSNVLLLGTGAGVGIARLLKRLFPFQSIIVWEQSAINIKVIFHLYDFSSDILKKRLVFALADNLKDGLSDLILKLKYIAFPTKILHWPWISPAEIKRLTTEVDLAYQAVEAHLKEYITSLQNKIDALQPDEDFVAILAPTADLIYQKWAKMIERNLISCGKRPESYLLDSPICSTFIKFAEDISLRLPKTIIILSQQRPNIPVRIPSAVNRVFITALNGMKLPVSVLEAISIDKDETCVVSDQEDVKELQDRFPDSKIIPVGVALDAETFVVKKCPIPADKTCRIALFAHNTHDSEDALGIRNSSHKRLWNAVRELIRKSSFFVEESDIPLLLKEAQKKASCQLTEKKLFDSFVDLIHSHMLPTQIRANIVKILDERHIDYSIYGRGFIEGPLYDPEELNGILDRIDLVVVINTDITTHQIILDVLAKTKPLLAKILYLPSHPTDKVLQRVPKINSPDDLIRAIEHKGERQNLLSTIESIRTELIESENTFASLVKKLIL